MKLLLPVAVFLLMVSIGMSLRPSEVVRHWRRLMGWPWVRLVLATFIVPPLVVLLMYRHMPLSRGEGVGLLLLAVVPGAPLMSRAAAKRGFDMHLAASYQVWGAVQMPLMLPLIVYTVAKLYDKTVWIPPRLLFAQIAENQFLPLLIGVALVYFATEFARKIQPPITVVGNVLLIVMIAAALWKMRAELEAITAWVLVAAIALAVASMLAIPLLLRAGGETNKTLALCNANRHIGLALLLAGDFLKARNAIPAIACYALVAPVAMLVYARAVRRPQKALEAVSS
jgi:BASS family bile acid:Na+ symporter